jgi:aspartyl-tRNA(Asn)/glutamyl-tRNA(Gln) amidotransferase subunit A
MENCLSLSIEELTLAYAKQALSPVDVTEAVLAQIEKLNPILSCFSIVTAVEARRSARDSEERWSKGKPIGELDGVPISVKDTLMVRGVPFRRGSTVTPETAATENAPVVDQTQAEGAVIVGITTTPEFGVGPVTISPLNGITYNPWNTAKNAGGSSGGAAASVAANMAFAGLTTDAGGSTRIPAGFCGVVGLKPTGGRLPTYPPNVAGALSSPGAITRSVADARMMLRLMAVSDNRDVEGLDAPSRDWLSKRVPPLRELRIAISEDLGYALRVSEEVLTAIRSVAERVESLGASVRSAHPSAKDPIEIFNTLFRAGFGYTLRGLSKEQLSQVSSPLRAAVMQGKEISLFDYLSAQEERRRLARIYADFFSEFDVLITPMTSVPAFEADRWVPKDFEDLDDPRAWTPFGFPANLTQCPAITIPCGLSGEGLPIGVQIVGPRFAEATILALAEVLEAAGVSDLGQPSLFE